MPSQNQPDSALKGVLRSPLLKWTGGKRSILKHLIELVPRSFNQYYEPFFGGGALFFALHSHNPILSDNNKDLINCYTQIRDCPNDVITYLSRYKNTEIDYYKVRNSIPRKGAEKAARLIFLVTLSFNGIYRINKEGMFNVPYGHKKHLRPCNPVAIHSASAALASAELHCQDFASAVASARKGDFVYFDPPYTVAHGNNGFLKYNAKIFSWQDQIRLSITATNLAKRGCNILVSNADHPSILSLYRGFKISRVLRHSIISASSNYRRPVTELLIYNEV